MKNQTVVITGATRGIGYALATKLAKHNRVVAVARDQHTLQEMAQTHGIEPLVADLSDLDEVRQLASTIAAQYPTLSVLINNAGLQQEWQVWQQESIEKLHQEMQVNFHAPLELSAMLLPVLAIQPESWLLNVTSVLAVAPKQSTPVYNASKAALRSFTQAIRYQCRDTNVQVVEVVPPVTATGLGAQGQSEQAVSANWVADEVIRQISQGKQVISIGKARWGLRLHRWLPGVLVRMMIAG